MTFMTSKSHLSRSEFIQQIREKASQVYESLKKAWESRPDNISAEDEKLLLRALARAKKIKEEIEKAFPKE